FMDSAEAHQKDVDATVLVRLTSTKGVEGYSIALGYNAQAVLPTKATIDGTITGTGAAEFTAFNVLEAETAGTYSVLVDMLEPIEGRVLPPGENQPLFRLVFNVLEAAPLGDTSFPFLEKAGDPPVSNELVIASNRVVPKTTPGTLTILPPKAPPPP